MQASRYKIQELIDTQGAVSTYQALDTLSNEPVLYYQYLAEPINNAVQILSDNIPNILNMHYTSGMTHVVTVFPPEKQHLTERLDDSQLEQFLLDTSQALEDASDAGVIHGDIRPDRLLFDGTKYLLEGYGVRWEFLPSRYSAPEKKQSIAGDVYSWAKTMGAFIPKSFPKTLAELLQRCLAKAPKDRPLPEDIVDEIKRHYLAASQSSKHPTMIDLKQTIADAQPDLLDNLFAKGQAAILTDTQERFIDQDGQQANQAQAVSIEQTTEPSEPNAGVHKDAVQASVAVEGSKEDVKLSSADLASNNLQDVAELRDSRADVSVEQTNSLPEVSSSARVTDASLSNQSISNENALMGSSVRTVQNIQAQNAVKPTAADLDTIDQGLAVIAEADTSATEAEPFLIEDDFSDLVTQADIAEVADAEIIKADISEAAIPDIEIPDVAMATPQVSDIPDVSDVSEKELPNLDMSDIQLSNPETSNIQIPTTEISNTKTPNIEISNNANSDTDVSKAEVILVDNLATQERNVEIVDTEITGLDAIEHKASFDDLTTTQVDLVPLDSGQDTGQDTEQSTRQNIQPALDDLDTNFNLAEDIKKDVDDTLLQDLLNDIPVTENNNAQEQVDIAADLESQAIQNIFPDPVEEVDAAEGFTVGNLDFSGEGFNQTSLATATEETKLAGQPTKDGQTPNNQIVNSQAIDINDGFDKTVFDETTFDTKVTAYNTSTVVSDSQTETQTQSEEKPGNPSNPVKFELEDTNSKDYETLTPTSFSVDELDFGAFTNGKSVSDAEADFKDEEKAHLDALQAISDESRKTSKAEEYNPIEVEQIVEKDLKHNLDNDLDTNLDNSLDTNLTSGLTPSSTPNLNSDLTTDSTTNLATDITTNANSDTQVDIAILDDDKDENIDTIEMPNSTQLERAFAALSSPLEGELATEFPSEIMANDTSTQVPIEIDVALDSELDAKADINTDNEEIVLSTAVREFTHEAEVNIENEFISESSEEILKSTSHLAEAEEIFDNLPPSKETLNVGKIEIDTADTQVDFSVEEEDLTLIDTDFSEINIHEVNIHSDESLSVNSENTSGLDKMDGLVDIDSEESLTKVATEDLSASAVSAISSKEDVPLVATPEHDENQSYDSFIDGMDDEAHAYTARAISQTPTNQTDTNSQDIDELKATQEILTLLEDEDDEPLVTNQLQKQASVNTSSGHNVTPQIPQDDLQDDMQDDLDAFLGDVLDNKNNSLPVDNSDGQSIDKETLFPVFTNQETLFANETVHLEPSATPTPESTNDTAIFTHTQYEQDVNANPTEASEFDLLAVDDLDDNDLQVIQTTDFGAESIQAESTPVDVDQTNQPVANSDPKTARQARRAQRRAEAEAKEEETDVFKTAFGKIAQMQASAQPESENLNQVDINNDDTDAGLLTTPTVEDDLLTAPPTVDESKLTAFESKHLSIAEKIAAKKAKTIADLDNNKPTQEPLKKTQLGRSSRKVGQGPDSFGEDNYDAIGKLPNKNQTAKTVEPKLTYFEMPADDDSDNNLPDNLSDETASANETPTQGPKKKRRNLFSREKKVKETNLENFETDFNSNLDTNVLTDIGIDETDFTMTAERQEEFNHALAVNPIKKAWRIGAASLVLLGAGAIVFMSLPDLLSAQETMVEESVTREAQSLPGLASDYPVYTQVVPANIDMISVIVVKSPENSKYPSGHEFNIFSNSPLSLDVKGEWELQGKYQNRILSNTVPFELPILGGEPLVFSFRSDF